MIETPCTPCSRASGCRVSLRVGRVFLVFFSSFSRFLVLCFSFSGDLPESSEDFPVRPKWEKEWSPKTGVRLESAYKQVNGKEPDFTNNSKVSQTGRGVPSSCRSSRFDCQSHCWPRALELKGVPCTLENPRSRGGVVSKLSEVNFRDYSGVRFVGSVSAFCEHLVKTAQPPRVGRGRRIESEVHRKGANKVPSVEYCFLQQNINSTLFLDMRGGGGVCIDR